MGQHIIEGDQPQRAAIGDEVDVEEIAQRRHQKPEAQEAQRPDAKQVLEILDRIEAEAAGCGEIEIPEARTEADDIERPDGRRLVTLRQRGKWQGEGHGQ